MKQQIALNVDCMEYMRTLPDKAFDLAVVDPPYGDGNGGSAKRFGGMFGAVYGENTRAHVADAHEREMAHRSITDSAEYSISTRVARTGGTWAAKFGKNRGVGCCPKGGVFSRAFPHLTRPDHLGRKLFFFAADALFSDPAKDKHSRKFFYGDVRICVDELQRKRQGV